MPKVKGHPVDFFEERNHDQLDRKSIFTIAQWDAQERAADDYPYAVYRDKASVERLAAEYLATYSDTAIYDKIGWRESWKANASEIKRLYTPAFVDAYQKNVASRDEAARLKAQPQPQPTTTPATRTVQGATATLKSVDHNPDEDLYIIELVDPGHLDEPQMVYVHVGDGEPQQTTSSSGQTYAASSYSDAVVPLPSQPSYGRTGTGKVQHIYLKRKK